MSKEWTVNDKMPANEARIIAAIITAGQIIGKDLADAAAVAKYEGILGTILQNEYYSNKRRENEELKRLEELGKEEE